MAALEIRISTKKTKVQKSKVDGEGLFATTFIPGGDRILAERCIFSGHLQSDSLSSAQPNRIELLPTFRDLDGHEIERIMHHCKRKCPSEAQGLTTQAFVDGSKASKRTLEKTFSSLCYPFVKDGHNTKVIRLFDQITYLNHSCHPNAEASWNDGLGKLFIYATRDIAVGDEITISCDVCRKDGLGTTYSLLGTKLPVIADFRAQFFDTDDFDVDFFGDANAMVGKAMDVTGVEKEDAEALIAAMNQVLRSIEAKGLEHSSLAAVFEMRYIIHAALFIRQKEEQTEKARVVNGVEDQSNTVQGGPTKDCNTDNNLAGFEREPGQEQMTRARVSDHDKKNDDADLADDRIKDSGSQDKSTRDQQSSNIRDEIFLNNFVHLLHSSQLSCSTAGSSTLAEAEAIRDNKDHFSKACRFKIREVAMLLRCLGIEHPRVRKAVTHAWHMADGNGEFEMDLRRNLAKLGVRLRRMWTDDGLVDLEIAKVGRPQMPAHVGRSIR